MARLIVKVDVDDLDAATRFCTSALELRVDRRFGGESVELPGAEAPIYLLVARPETPSFDGASAGRNHAIATGER